MSGHRVEAKRTLNAELPPRPPQGILPRPVQDPRGRRWRGSRLKLVSTPTGAVFLSYASEDAAAAQRIATALRNAGIEVRFDKSELRGGDAWDRMIHEQIQACALFMPVISANAHARVEGYFRLEWKLAVDRSHRMAPDQAFLMPVVIDDTRQNDTRIPDRFRELQWTRLPGGETSPVFVERIRRLLSPEAAHASAEARPRAAAVQHAAAAAPQPASSPTTSPQTQWVPLMIAAVAVIGFGYFAVDKFVLSKHEPGAKQAPAQPAQAITQVQVPEKSIAVLPFADLSEKHDQEYFSDGFAEELIDALTRVPEPARAGAHLLVRVQGQGGHNRRNRTHARGDPCARGKRPQVG